MFRRSDERRTESRKPANRRAVLVAPGLEVECRITDESRGGFRLRLDRRIEIKGRVLVVEIADAAAVDVDILWTKGQEAGGRRHGQASLRGLIPQRLAPARDAWLRAGGR